MAAGRHSIATRRRARALELVDAHNVTHLRAGERAPRPGWVVEVSEVLTERRWAFSVLDYGTHLLTAGEHPRWWLRATCGHLLPRSADGYSYPRGWPCRRCVEWVIRGEDNPEPEEVDRRFHADRLRVAVVAPPRIGPLGSAA